ncbi:MAG: hypothetical protein ACC645_05955 [Pirellulales bacterium]
MTQPDLDNCQAEQLATLLSSCNDTLHTWTSDDLAAILRHQLSLAPETDIETYVLRGAPRPRTEPTREGRFDSYTSLFQEKEPPLDLLRRVKDCAKSAVRDPDAPLPDGVATMVYFVAIAVALTARGERITRLTDEGLRWGFEWSLRQTWVAESLRPLLTAGLDALDGQQAGEGDA